MKTGLTPPVISSSLVSQTRPTSFVYHEYELREFLLTHTENPRFFPLVYTSRSPRPTRLSSDFCLQTRGKRSLTYTEVLPCDKRVGKNVVPHNSRINSGFFTNTFSTHSKDPVRTFFIYTEQKKKKREDNGSTSLINIPEPPTTLVSYLLDRRLVFETEYNYVLTLYSKIT